MEWINVEDRLPEDKQLVRVKNDTQQKVCRFFVTFKYEDNGSGYEKVPGETFFVDMNNFDAGITIKAKQWQPLNRT